MQTFLYLLAAAVTIGLIAVAPVPIGWGLMIAWFAWCGGILFEKLGIAYRIKCLFEDVKRSLA